MGILILTVGLLRDYCANLQVTARVREKIDAITCQTENGRAEHCRYLMQSLETQVFLSHPMASWIRTGAGSRRVFRRSLGVTETVFYYDSHTNGTADTVSHTTIEVPKEHAALFGTKNVARAWRSLKSRYPLLAATIKRDNSTLHFVVAEDRLNGSVPNEVSFASISSAAEGEAVALATVHSERKLSDDLLCRITILARTDDPSLFHLVIHNAHSISDGVANISVLKDFLRLVSSPSHETVPDLESRLSLAVASDSLVPSRKMSLAKQRWRGAAGQIVAKIQNAKRIVIKYLYVCVQELT